MAKPAMTNNSIVEELQAIKKLLVLGLLKEGVTQSQVGKALGIDQSAVSRLVPGASLKPKKPRER